MCGELAKAKDNTGGAMIVACRAMRVNKATRMTSDNTQCRPVALKLPLEPTKTWSKTRFTSSKQGTQAEIYVSFRSPPPPTPLTTPSIETFAPQACAHRAERPRAHGPIVGGTGNETPSWSHRPLECRASRRELSSFGARARGRHHPR